MSNPGTATLPTTAAGAAAQGDAVSHLPPLTPEPMPTPTPASEPEREPEPLPDHDPEPRPGQEPLWSLPATGFMPVTVPASGAAVAAALQ
jgi:hypothetical protein